MQTGRLPLDPIRGLVTGIRQLNKKFGTRCHSFTFSLTLLSLLLSLFTLSAQGGTEERAASAKAATGDGSAAGERGGSGTPHGRAATAASGNAHGGERCSPIPLQRPGEIDETTRRRGGARRQRTGRAKAAAKRRRRRKRKGGRRRRRERTRREARRGETKRQERRSGGRERRSGGRADEDALPPSPRRFLPTSHPIRREGPLDAHDDVPSGFADAADRHGHADAT